MTEAPKIRKIKRIARTELVPFTRQLASMSAAGMPILSTIMALEEQCTDPEFGKVLTFMTRTIESGEPLSHALAAFPEIFDDMYVNMVIAGEQSGEFAGILKRLGSLLQASSRLRRRVKSAMTYPLVIISIALALAAGLIQFVVPVFAEMFAGFGKPLPALTQTLVDISDFVKRNWYFVLGGIAAAAAAFRWWKSTAHGRFLLDEFLLKMPVFGELNLKSGISRFCRLLA